MELKVILSCLKTGHSLEAWSHCSIYAVAVHWGFQQEYHASPQQHFSPLDLTFHLPMHLDKPFFWGRLHYIVHFHTRVTILLLTRTVRASSCTLLASHCNEHTQAHCCHKKNEAYDGCHNDGDVHCIMACFFHEQLNISKVWMTEVQSLIQTHLLQKKDRKMNP